jgi:hypothetical protein
VVTLGTIGILSIGSVAMWKPRSEREVMPVFISIILSKRPVIMISVPFVSNVFVSYV